MEIIAAAIKTILKMEIIAAAKGVAKRGSHI